MPHHDVFPPRDPTHQAAVLDDRQYTNTDSARTDKKARDELAGKVGKSKGPMNTGSQGIKKSGKK